jgi:hypothetical protein
MDCGGPEASSEHYLEKNRTNAKKVVDGHERRGIEYHLLLLSLVAQIFKK